MSCKLFKLTEEVRLTSFEIMALQDIGDGLKGI